MQFINTLKSTKILVILSKCLFVWMNICFQCFYWCTWICVVNVCVCVCFNVPNVSDSTYKRFCFQSLPLLTSMSDWGHESKQKSLHSIFKNIYDITHTLMSVGQFSNDYTTLELCYSTWTKHQQKQDGNPNQINIHQTSKNHSNLHNSVVWNTNLQSKFAWWLPCDFQLQILNGNHLMANRQLLMHIFNGNHLLVVTWFPTHILNRNHLPTTI
jgi:hypothetical protein